MIVAIGESVVAVGIGAGGLPVDAGLVAGAVLGRALTACLWWSYFGGDEEAAERAMSAAPVAARPRLAIEAFGYWHLPILLGVVLIAAWIRRGALALGGGRRSSWRVMRSSAAPCASAPWASAWSPACSPP